MVLEPWMVCTPVKISDIIIFSSCHKMAPGLPCLITCGFEDTKGRASGKIRLESDIAQGIHLLSTPEHEVSHARDEGGRLSLPAQLLAKPFDAFMELAAQGQAEG